MLSCSIIDNLDMRKDYYDDHLLGRIPDSLNFLLVVNEDSSFFKVNGSGEFSIEYRIATSNSHFKSGIWNGRTSALELFFETPQDSFNLILHDKSNDSAFFHFEVDKKWFNQAYLRITPDTIRISKPNGIADTANFDICSGTIQDIGFATMESLLVCKRIFFVI